MPAANLPQYRSHKIVHAVRIKEIKKADTKNRSILVPDAPGIIDIEVDNIFVRMKNMVAGWYYVVDEKGYASAMSPEAFEADYSLATYS